MASGLSKRPCQLAVVADDENVPSSVRKVLSDDDFLMMEILLRLPVLSLFIFKAVCKQWKSLITSSSFTLTRTRIPPVDPPSGLFLERWSDTNSDEYDYDLHYDFVPFDPRIPAKKSIYSRVCLKRIEQSCNGLLLCFMGDNKYYVCNPSLSMFKMLPPIHDNVSYERDGYKGMMNIAFDPTKSPSYKVVNVRSVKLEFEEDDSDDDDNDDETDSLTRIQIYSSETGVWRVWEGQFSERYFDEFSHGLYWDGAIHWINFYHPSHIFKLDIVDDGPVFSEIQITLPLTLTVRQDKFHQRKLLTSRGSLLLLCKDDDSQNLNIFEMKNGYSVWSLKYCVNLDDMMRPYPTWKVPAYWSCRDILSVDLGERDEDSFIVMELSGKVLKYKFKSETVSELFDSGREYEDRCCEYITSFAHV